MVNSPTLVFTGGHHTSALAVAQALKSQGWRIIWFGHRHSMAGDKRDSAEYQEVTASSIEFINLKAGKFYRTLHPLKLIRIPIGFVQAFLVLLRLRLGLRTDLKGIVSFGGYLAVPVVICGWLLGVPGLTHEQTTVAGWANRLISHFVKKIAVTWLSSLDQFPKSKVVFTGLPLRPEILKLKTSSSHPHPDSILIIGGKQGSHVLNQVVFAALPRLLKKYRVVHQTGSSSIHSDFQLAKSYKSPTYQPHDYLFPADYAQVLNQAEVVVSRSGAHAVYEYAFLKKRCVLVPIPWGSHGEQEKNAQILVDHNLAVLLPQGFLSPKTLLTSLTSAQKLKPSALSVPADGLEKLVKLIIRSFT